ncbi:respiratory nitrite reductase specific cytochrome c biogenesis protein NrfK /respiratory nitrite reductase specific cytochrome c biogenesis protein NrfL [Porphyromonadaceae bacterium NLAE-zl-C104]|nr:respiratory nitrite reductase specific cytochrome c biogenesis protein NrfK /respiratory nitrite reductase specific cytochrome c biogenesis protein NrfL [Porphyromonadaceae bacterium KH3R12]SFS52133.1 respiratory nitrite reductase specific cytochrome c biogenesis protein NrfK /respiratory nitrite reductase specific cytochrome c biogenesis protein NrfL [Porphyromonadaceae bacterium NLAE-zl-C104]
MNKNTSRKIWEHPWGYAEGFIVAAGVLLSGILLQFAAGNIETALFASPVNTIVGALFVAGLLAVHFLSGKSRVVRWLSSVYATIPALVILLILAMILGILPQFAAGTEKGQLPPHPFTSLGWYQMTTSWPFVLLCFYNLSILGLTTLRRTTRKHTWREIGFYLNHLGLFIALLGGILGSADMERLTMTIQEGQVEWRGNLKTGEIKELPLAIQLDTFMIEEYEPKLVIIENGTGKMLPASRPESYMFEGIGKATQLAGVTLEITDYLPHAAIFRDSTFMNVVPMMMEGATTAIKVKADKPGLAQPIEGWVSNGSYLFPHIFLQIDEETSVAMPVQEVKKYSSHVTAFTESGITKEAVIEVNKPLQVEDWMIYQYSYDDTKGKYSDTSVFELVRAPWLKAVYTGIFMLLAGALFLFIAGPKKRTI